MEEQKFILRQTYDASVKKVWIALTDITQMRQWFFPMMKHFEPTVGFSTQWDVHHNGNIYRHRIEVTQSIANTMIAYTWQYRGYPGNSTVSFALEDRGAQTKLTMTQNFTESFQSDKYPDFSTANFKQGWTHFIGALKEYVERPS